MGTQIAVIFVLFWLTLVLGASCRPADSELAPFADNLLAVNVPGFIEVGPDQLPLEAVSWLESHGEPLALLADTDWAQDLPTPSADTTRVALSISYAGYRPDTFAFEAYFRLPNGAKFVQCRTHNSLNCGSDKVSLVDSHGRPTELIYVNGFLTGVESDSDFTTIIVIADISDLPGMNFTRSRNKAEVRFPYVKLTSDIPDAAIEEGDDYPHFRVGTSAFFDRADRLTWSQSPDSATSILVPGQSDTILDPKRQPMAQWWSEQNPDFYRSDPPISGYDTDVNEKDSSNLFMSGVWFGVAGGAAVTFVQLLVVWWPRTRL